MTLTEASELARSIDGNTAYMVVAIGRFIDLECITQASPWGISVLRRADGTRQVLWSESDWTALHTQPSPSQKPGQQPGRQAVTHIGQAAGHELDDQPLLF